MEHRDVAGRLQHHRADLAHLERVGFAQLGQNVALGHARNLERLFDEFAIVHQKHRSVLDGSLDAIGTAPQPRQQELQEDQRRHRQQRLEEAGPGRRLDQPGEQGPGRQGDHEVEIGHLRQRAQPDDADQHHHPGHADGGQHQRSARYIQYDVVEKHGLAPSYVRLTA